MAITAIETRYAGCRFRSRLEARWAVFFDHLGIRWEYEPQGFMIRRSQRDDQAVRCGFGSYYKNRRPWYLDNATWTGYGQDEWLLPILDRSESGSPGAYRAARSARFEHGERG